LYKSYLNNFASETFVCQTNGVISDSIVQNWTPQALECYKLNSCCENCSITKARYSFKCQMKHIVDILLKTQGLPDEKAIINSQDNTKTTITNDDIVA
jgi:hypothetical protein